MGTFKKPIARCQCYKKGTTPCEKQALSNSVFCQEHQDCRPPPLSGAEPPYIPHEWNKDPALVKSHNCYSYAWDIVDPSLIEKCQKDQNDSDKCRARFHQPGCVHGERNELDVAERRNCKAVDRLIRADNPNIIKSSFYEQCPKNTYKTALVVDKGDDFHFYKQHAPNSKDSTPFFSDKGGSNPVKREDAIGQPIFNPELASRDFRWKGSDLNYKDFCGFYCVPHDGSVRLASSAQTGGRRTRRRLLRRQRTRRQRQRNLPGWRK